MKLNVPHVYSTVVQHGIVCVRVRARTRGGGGVRACVLSCACVRTCVRACVRVCVCGGGGGCCKKYTSPVSVIPDPIIINPFFVITPTS